jgi:hypothetical protein
MDGDALVAFLIPNAQQWIASQRDAHRPHSSPLPAADSALLQRYFRQATLERSRIRRVPQIQNPPFYADLARVGIPIPLDFRQMTGITFDDTILISASYCATEPGISLLFHEMVHVAQYAFLGVSEFAIQYVKGWAQYGFDYFSIPLEREAYDLQERFTKPSRNPFSVETIVETNSNPDSVLSLMDNVQSGRDTFGEGSKEREGNNAVALREYMESRDK